MQTSAPPDGGPEFDLWRSSAFVFLRGVLGGAVGGVVGYLLFRWLLTKGFYALVMPGALLGLGAGLATRGKSLTLARKIPLVCGMAGASVIALAVVVPSAGMALALLSLCYACLTFAAASVWSLPADVAPTPGHVASIGGIQNFASNLAGVLGATTTGVLIAATGGSYVAALVLSGGFSLLGAFSYLVIVGRVEPLPVDA